MYCVGFKDDRKGKLKGVKQNKRGLNRKAKPNELVRAMSKTVKIGRTFMKIVKIKRSKHSRLKRISQKKNEEFKNSKLSKLIRD